MSSVKPEHRILRQLKRHVSLPAVLLVERNLDTLYGSYPMQTTEGSELSLDNLEGYLFAWGLIVERRVDNQILWEFCLEALLSRCHTKGFRHRFLQIAVFDALKQLMPDWVAEDWAVNSTQLAGWKFYAGSSFSSLILRCHFSDEAAARTWLSDKFLPDVLPGLLYQVQCLVDQ